MKKLSIIITLITLCLSSVSLSEEYHSNPQLLEWIPAACCVTNDCCWEISESEITILPDQEAEIKSTGQVRKYQFSQDTKFYRCACDYDNVNKVWNRHQGANTRCLFVPNRGF